MLLDAVRAVDLLGVAFPKVDPRRLGAIGHSLGAKEVLYLSAFDPRVRATVFSEGGIGLSSSYLWTPPGTSARRSAAPGSRSITARSSSSAPAFLLLGGDSADGDASWPHVEAALPVWSLLKADEALGLFNHRQGHAFPKAAQTRANQWLGWFLRT